MIPKIAAAIRLRPGNLNHHLYNNNGTWFVHFTVHPSPFTKERVRRSLQTKSLQEARLLRDTLLVQIQKGALQ